MAEVITFGEAMIRLAPPNFRRLEQTRSLDVEVGGAELNTAVALARLGHPSTWVSRLTDNSLGRLIANHGREAGVNTDHVVWTREDRVGLYFLEFGAAPRASSVLYDRKGAAMTGIAPGMVPWGEVFQGAKWFHTTGITPALSPSAATTTKEALQAARKAGISTSMDLNYRAKLWSYAEAGKCMTELLAHTDVLFASKEDVEHLFGITSKDHEDAARRTAEHFGLKVVAITLRESSQVWKNSWSALAVRGAEAVRTRTYEVEIVDRLGAGDSFAAGLIHGLLEGDLQKGVDWGVAISALKHSIPGDFAWVTRDEVEALLAGGGMRISR
jgi:2-dehydro-3-deoxygluconokinase